MLRQIKFIFLCLAGIALCLYPWMSAFGKSCVYGLSLSLKSVIVFLLPFLIFGLIYQTFCDLAKKASWAILVMICVICISNFLSTFFSFFAGKIAYRMDVSLTLIESKALLEPSFQLLLPQVISNGRAILFAAFFGLVMNWLFPIKAKQFSIKLSKITDALLKTITLIIPLFIAGFLIKLLHDGLFFMMLKGYAKIFLLVISALSVYIGSIYFITNRFKPSSFIESLKNMMPAALVGFGSMSSAAAMPFTVLGVAKNSKNPNLAKSLVPATVNIHLIGDCFAIPIFAFAILKSFGISEPSFASFLPFALSFVLAKFSVAAVPGGGVLVMLPILESYLGLQGDMLSMITALYILFDPVITCANIFGNGAFAQAIDRIVNHIKTVALIRN